MGEYQSIVDVQDAIVVVEEDFDNAQDEEGVQSWPHIHDVPGLAFSFIELCKERKRP